MAVAATVATIMAASQVASAVSGRWGVVTHLRYRDGDLDVDILAPPWVTLEVLVFRHSQLHHQIAARHPWVAVGALPRHLQRHARVDARGNVDARLAAHYLRPAVGPPFLVLEVNFLFAPMYRLEEAQLQPVLQVLPSPWPPRAPGEELLKNVLHRLALRVEPTAAEALSERVAPASAPAVQPGVPKVVVERPLFVVA